MKHAEYKINKDFGGHKAGETVKFAVDKKGTPLDPMWRRRLRDAKIDNCMSPKAVTPKTQSKTEKGT